MFVNAAVNAMPVLFFSGSTRAYFENTSIHVSRYLCESFSLDNRPRPTRSACHNSLIPRAIVRRRRNLVFDCLCSVYDFSPINHSRAVLTSTFACRCIESNSLKLAAWGGFMYASMSRSRSNWYVAFSSSSLTDRYIRSTANQISSLSTIVAYVSTMTDRVKERCLRTRLLHVCEDASEDGWF